MRAVINSLATSMRRIAEPTRIVPIDRCYHYRGFRYGGYGNNPYEDYVVGLANGRNLQILRSAFAEAILQSRPTCMGEALQIKLQSVALWDFPWSRSRPADNDQIRDPADNPDIVCHYCAQGILASHINRELRWLEAAFASIRKVGYAPESLGFIRCQELQGQHFSTYLVLDGNHRISALHAIGMRKLAAKIATGQRVRRIDANRWPRVVAGAYNLENALMVFDRYFSPLNEPLRPMHEAHLVLDESPLWL
jgi:hypothetical protein